MKYKTQKRWKHENQKKGNLKKEKKERNRVSCFNIYIVMFAFLSSTLEVGRWWKLNEMFVFWILSFAMSDCYDFYENFMRSFQK